MSSAPHQPFLDIRLMHEPVHALPFEPFPQPAGAECIFLGRTRSETHPQHGGLVRLTYEAHEVLAERTLRELAEQAVQQYHCLAVRIHHALGDVPLGETSVLVQVVCGHRGESFEACRFLIDGLKKHAPIWKREIWQHGESWVEGTPVPNATSSRI